MVGHRQFILAEMRIKVIVFGLVVIVLVLLTGCDRNMNTMGANTGSGSTKLSQGIDPNNEGSVQLRIGDDPATTEGRIMALRLDISSMKLWNSSALAITACAAGNGNGVYDYTLIRGSAPAIGQTLDITGMTDAANNGTFVMPTRLVWRPTSPRPVPHACSWEPRAGFFQRQCCSTPRLYPLRG